LMFSDVKNNEDTNSFENINISNNRYYLLINTSKITNNIEDYRYNFEEQKFYNNSLLILRVDSSDVYLKNNKEIKIKPESKILEKIFMPIEEKSIQAKTIEGVKFFFSWLRFILLSIFYVFGTIFFCEYFIKKNIIGKKD